MRWHWTRRRHAPGTAARRPRRPRLEFLEERGSPSVLPFSGLPDPPLERPALAPGNVREEPWGLAPARGDGGALAATAEGGAACEPAWAELTDFRQEGGQLQTVLRRGPSTTATRGPTIVVTAQEGENGEWTFTGHVEANSPGGLIVTFGGLPTLRGQTTDVDEHGNFSLTIQLGECEGGRVTAQTIDWEGFRSNVAEDFVHRTGCAQ